MIVFDTSAVINFLRGGEETKDIVENAEKDRNTVAITTISLFELLSPIYHKRLQRENRVLRAFAGQTIQLGLDSRAADEASKIMGALLRLGVPINTLDVLICGIAVSNNADNIVTLDRDFEQVEKVADINIRFI